MISIYVRVETDTDRWDFQHSIQRSVTNWINILQAHTRKPYYPKPVTLHGQVSKKFHYNLWKHLAINHITQSTYIPKSIWYPSLVPHSHLMSYALKISTKNIHYRYKLWDNTMIVKICIHTKTRPKSLVSFIKKH